MGKGWSEPVSGEAQVITGVECSTNMSSQSQSMRTKKLVPTILTSQNILIFSTSQHNNKAEEREYTDLAKGRF